MSGHFGHFRARQGICKRYRALSNTGVSGQTGHVGGQKSVRFTKIMGNEHGAKIGFFSFLAWLKVYVTRLDPLTSEGGCKDLSTTQDFDFSS